MSIFALLKNLLRTTAVTGIALLVVAASADTEVFRSRKIIDSSGTHRTAITYLLPDGWKSQDAVEWEPLRQGSPMLYNIDAFSPDGRFVCTFANGAAFTYNNMGKQKSLGRVPPDRPSDFLVEYIEKLNQVSNVEVLDSKETPIPSAWKTAPGATLVVAHAVTATTKVRFVKNGAPYIAKASFDFDQLDSGTPFARRNNFTGGRWKFSNLSSVAAPEAQFPRALKLAGIIVSSQRMDPQFFQAFYTVLQQQVSNQLSHDRAAFNERLRHLGDETASTSTMGALREQMAAKDRSSQRFCDYLLDQTRYTDGANQYVVPSGYSFAAIDGKGGLLVTNNPSYNNYKEWNIQLKKVY